MTEDEHAYVAAVGTPAEHGAAVVLYEKGYDSDHLAHLRRVATQSPSDLAAEMERALYRHSLGEQGLRERRGVPVEYRPLT